MRLAAAVIIGLIAAAFLSNASAKASPCQIVRASGASLLEVCGDRLNAFRLSLAETKLGASGVTRQVSSDMHGYFSFLCPVQPICSHEPALRGFFISAEQWQKTSKDEKAIQQVLLGRPMMAISTSGRGGSAKEALTASCPAFDVSVNSMVGKAGCFSYSKTSETFVAMVVADDRVAFVLTSSFPDQPASDLEHQVRQLMPRLKIERATGDAALLEWMQ